MEVGLKNPSTLEQGKMDPVARKETLTNQLHVCHLQKKQLYEPGLQNLLSANEKKKCNVRTEGKCTN